MTKKVGTRQEVVAGKALQTKGGLTADDLFVVTSAKGVEKIVSKKASNAIKQRLAQNAAVAADAESSGSDSELAKVSPVGPPQESKTKPAKKKESSRVTPPLVEAEVAAVADVDAATMKSLSDLSGKPKAAPKAAAKPKAEKKAAKPKAPRKPKQPKVVAEDEVEDDADEVEAIDE